MATYDTVGTKVFIGPATTLTSGEAISEATIAWVEIGEVESITPFGDQASARTFASLSDARVRKGKGTRDAGDITINCADDPEDEGQQDAIAAEKTRSHYPMKVVPPAEHGKEFYFAGPVMSARLNTGAQNATIMREFAVAINTDVFEADA